MHALTKASSVFLVVLECVAIHAAPNRVFAQGASASVNKAAAAAGPATNKDKSRDSTMTPNGVCHTWTQPFGGSNFPEDASYSPCALDKVPVLVSAPAMPGPPRSSIIVHASYLLIVDADGRVNGKLTRPGTVMGDANNYFDVVADSMTAWRFRPGMRKGKPVRSARALVIATIGSRNNALPAHIEWKYRSSADADTVLGTWVAEAPVPPLSAGQTDSLYMTFLHKLVAMHVMVPLFGSSYCLVMNNGDSVAHARIQARARVMSLDGGPFNFGVDRLPPFNFAPYGCERSADPLRIILPRVNLTENGRVTFETGGDFLPNYPDGLNGRSWRGWHARCTGVVPERGSTSVDCDVSVGEPFTDFANWYRNNEAERARVAQHARAQGDSVWITAIVSTSGSTTRDTLRSAIGSLPLITDHAVIDTLTPCGGWVAYTEQNDSSDLFVIHGNPYPYVRGMRILQVKHGPTRTYARDAECAAQTGHSAKFAAFVAGGIGGKATSPIRLIYTNQEQPYVIDPSRHTIPPHLTFSISELRPETRAGKRLQMILRTETNQIVIPIVVLPSGRGGSYAVASATQISANIFQVNASSDHPPDGKVFVYLIRLP